eukprot:scaffold8761_cov97-Isochrysis_galbana.AAC.1
MVGLSGAGRLMTPECGGGRGKVGWVGCPTVAFLGQQGTPRCAASLPFPPPPYIPPGRFQWPSQRVKGAQARVEAAPTDVQCMASAMTTRHWRAEAEAEGGVLLTHPHFVAACVVQHWCMTWTSENEHPGMHDPDDRKDRARALGPRPA